MGGIASIHSPQRQRGLALLMLLALFALSAAYMLVSSLNKSSVALSLTRADKNRAVMQEAKAALIAWAASETSQPGTGQGFQPGALPCPDVTNDGTSDTSGSSCTGLLGRLPYKTLKIAELRDASGERLWYSVSSNFVRSTSNVINSDKQGTLTISGLAPASHVIAVVLAPGMRLGNQDRGSAGVNTAANYLEDTNGIANSANYVAALENLTDSVVANLFNDQTLAITHQDLFSVVDPVVAARIERDIVRQFIYDPSAPGDTSKFYGAWGRFPFAAPFVDPGSSSFKGQAATYEGLLPVIATLPYNWNTATVTVTQAGGSGNISADCSDSTQAQLNCTITNTITSTEASSINDGSSTYSAASFRMSATVDDVGKSFVQLPDSSNLSTSNPGRALTSPVFSGSLDGSAVGTVALDATLPWTFDGTFGGGAGSQAITVKIDQPVVSALTSTSSSDIAGWFNNNEWHKLTYYAVSPGYAPGGGGVDCSSTICLTVNNLATTPNNDKRAILILAGRPLNASARPSSLVTDYLEAQNGITAGNIVLGNYTFETALGNVSSSGVAVNDRVIVVAP